ncbi:MAG TPA: hypothetical protein VHC19_27635 [Pirellulales bacterium]|nr:hypothetical protein [Pirellulales bacterium]
MQILSGKAGPLARLQILLIMPTFAALSKQLLPLNFSGNQELFCSFVRRDPRTASLRAIHQAQRRRSTSAGQAAFARYYQFASLARRTFSDLVTPP